MSIHRSEWLTQAQKVPVGQKRRVYHGAESTAAMDVYNNPDSWSCYCHRCHEGGKVYKQVIEKVQEDAPVYRKYYKEKETCTLDYLAGHEMQLFKRMVMLLHAKGMSTALIEPYKPRYNLKDHRLCFSFDGVTIGRDCTGLSTAKWLVYHNDNPSSYVYLQGNKTGLTHEPIVMVEDLFSAIKIKHYTGFSTLWIQGTRLDDEAVRLFIQSSTAREHPEHERERLPPIGVCCFDGDAAGLSAKSSVNRRFNLLGLPIHNVDVPIGLDPKDLSADVLVKLFKHLEEL